MDLSIAIINMDNWMYTQKCLDSIRCADSKGLEIEIFVIDNCSTDGSLEAIKSQFPDVQLIINKSVLGFGANNNQVLKVAKGRYMLVLNNDTEVAEHTLREIVRYMDEHSGIGILGCKTYLLDGEIQKTCGRFPTFWGEFKALTFDQIVPWTLKYTRWRMMHDFSYEEAREVDWISGVFHLIRREVVNEIRYYDESFFMYYEDMEYCHRLKNETEYNVTYFPDVSILHYHGKTSVRKKTGSYEPFVHNVKSCFYYMKKSRGRLVGSIFQILVGITHHLLLVVAFISAVVTIFRVRLVRNTLQKFWETVTCYYVG